MNLSTLNSVRKWESLHLNYIKISLNYNFCAHATLMGSHRNFFDLDYILRSFKPLACIKIFWTNFHQTVLSIGQGLVSIFPISFVNMIQIKDDFILHWFLSLRTVVDDSLTQYLSKTTLSHYSKLIQLNISLP